MGYFDLNVDNNTGVAVDAFTLTDDIPAQFNVTSVNVGSYSGFGGTVGVRYQASDNLGVWIIWPGSPVSQGTTLTTSLPADTFITRLEFSYGTIPAGFAGAPRINGTTLSAGENNTTIDAGLVVAASIGNYVFFDANNNGIQDGGDTPVQSVTVRLLDGAGNQAVDERGNQIPDAGTDASGNYSFTGLRPGTYALAFSSLPVGDTFARRDGGGDDTIDSDPNRFTGRTATTTLSPGENDTSWDAGVVHSAALGDFVWEDSNANGQQDSGKLGVAGVTVRLLDGSNNAIDNPNTATIGDAYVVTTDSNGFYSFVGLPPNETYRVRFDLPTGYVFTQSNQGSDGSDSDGLLSGQTNVSSVQTIDITTLTPGVTDNTWDQGVLRPSALGNFVWSDANDDGLQTGGEPGIAGVTVRLPDSGGNAVDDSNTSGTQNYVTTTDGSGNYSFTNLYPGSYIVEFVTPNGYERSTYFVGAGTNAGVDSDVQVSGPGAGRTPTIVLPYNTTDNTRDAGFVLLASVGDFVWFDMNNDGVQDLSEDGAPGVTVNLLDMTTCAERRLTDNPSSDVNAYWSNDGTKLVFQSNRSGHWQLYIYNLAAATTRQLIDIPLSAFNPVYSNGGGQIVFRAQEANGHSVLNVIQQDGSALHTISDPAGSASRQRQQSGMVL